MRLSDSKTDDNMTEIGSEMHGLMRELYPICRSITGDGVRQTLNILKKDIPLNVHEVASGTKVFDWTVPKEWNIKDAYVKNSKGKKIIDFKKSNLHVLNYSVPVYKKVSLEELKEHLFTLPEHPDWIPYRTSYFSENWGFCINHNQFEDLEQDTYEVWIESSLENGHLTYGEYYIEGEISDEVLISTHICHPSLCNDNLSGIALTTFLAKHLSKLSMHYSYRFIFIPGTIGSITWLSVNENRLSDIKHGLVAACVGDCGKFNYKKSRHGNAEIDRAVLNALSHSGFEFNVIDFFPFGYDERQYCSPGINLPVGCFMRTPHGEYPEYHTSADNLKFVSPDCLEESLSIFFSIINVLENNNTYLNLNPKCEPQLGKRGLYDAIGGTADSREKQLTMLWVLNLSDGKHSLLDISEKSNLEISLIKKIADILLKHNLLKVMT